jgi:hypothetical protein
MEGPHVINIPEVFYLEPENRQKSYYGGPCHF